MNRSQAIEVLKQLRPRLAARGIAHAGIFGSVARGTATPKSDIDVVVTPVLGKQLDLFACGGIQSALEEGFGSSVDLVIEPVRSPTLKQAIERDRVNAF